MELGIKFFGPSKTVLRQRLTNLEGAVNNTTQYLMKRRLELNPQADFPVPILERTSTARMSKRQIKAVIKSQQASLQFMLSELARITTELVKRANLKNI